MSATVTPLYNMNVVAGEALMNQIALQLKVMQDAKTTTQKRYSDWRSIAYEPAPSAQQSNELIATSLVTVLLDGLFGMGLFSGLGDAAHGMAQMTAMEHASRGNSQLQRSAQLNEALNKRLFQTSQGAQNGQTQQMKLLQQMMAMLLMSMLTQQGGDETGSAGGSKGQQANAKNADVVPDVLRHPAVARFKQNRQSIACIRTMFQRQADVVTPKFQALKYAM